MKFPLQFRRGFGFLFILFVVVFETSCQSQNRAVSSDKITEIGSESFQIPKMPSDPSDSVFYNLSNKSLFQFYKERNGGLAWVDRTELTISGDSLLYFISRLIYSGLQRNNYHYFEMMRLKRKLTSTREAQRMDALLTDAFLMLAVDLKYGATVHRTADTVQQRLLDRAVRDDNPVRILTLQQPGCEGYRLLRVAMLATIDSLRLNGALLSDTVFTRFRQGEILGIMAANLERWRLETPFVPDRYIFINIPSFTLNVIEDNNIKLESRVIVGTPEKPTPDLTSSIECIVAYPYWHVPRKIATEEFLPQIKKNRLFLSRNNFDVLDRKGNVLNPDSINWNAFTMNYFPVSLRQREGTDNSLGILKFVFDNPYAVYLHDTNAKQLFKNSVRAYSHGCIRIEKAEDLAHYLMTGDVDIKSKTLIRLLKAKERRTIAIKDQMPIYVRYLTCESKNQEVYLYQDIYNRDQLLLDRLNSRYLTIL